MMCGDIGDFFLIKTEKTAVIVLIVKLIVNYTVPHMHNEIAVLQVPIMPINK
jgi:hypothetical protein